MSLGVRLTHHTQANLVHGFFSAASSVAISALLFRELGAEYGLFALVWMTVTKLDVFDDSIGAYLVTSVAKQEASPDRATGHTVLSSGTARYHARPARAYHLYFMLAVASGMVTGVALLVLVEGEASALLALGGGFGLLISMLTTSMARTLEGMESYGALRTAQSVSNVLRVVVVVVLLYGGVSSSSPVIGALVGLHAVLLGVLTLLVGRRTSLRKLLSAAPGDTYRPVLRFVRPLLSAKASAILSYRLDVWVLQIAIGPAAVAVYAVGDAVASLVAQLIDVFKAILPVSIREWRADAQWITQFVMLTGKASGLVIAVSAASLFAIADPLIVTWFGEGTPDEAVTVAQLLLVFYGSTAFRSSLQTILIGQGHFRVLERHFVQAGLGNIALSTILAHVIGAPGPALATLLAGVYLLQQNTRSAESALGLARGSYMRQVTLPGAATVLVTTVVGLTVPLGVLSYWIEIPARAGIVAALATSVYWLWLFEPKERDAVRRSVRPRTAR